MNKEVRAVVDQLLLEQGEYIPLEYLLAEGRLDFGDYENWRAGEVPRLEDVLFGDLEQSAQHLDEAEAYAKALRLEPEPLSYQGWGAAVGVPLSFSSHSDRDRRFHTAYRRPAQQPQMDLFIDAAANRLVNSVIHSLIGRDYSEARRLLERLFDTEPGHPRLGALELMVDAGDRLAEPLDDCDQELKFLRESLQPIVVRELGRDGSSLLIPYWRRLTAELQGRAFDPIRPESHASFTAREAFDWEGVLAAIEKEPGWLDQPVLVIRHAHACGKLHRELAALQSWFHLCWVFPDHADAIAHYAEPSVRQAWRDFLAVEPELTAAEFPAWLLLVRPGLAARLLEPHEAGACPPAYSLVYQLQLEPPEPAQTPQSKSIEHRRQLQALAPRLFEHYMRTKADS